MVKVSQRIILSPVKRWIWHQKRKKSHFGHSNKNDPSDLRVEKKIQLKWVQSLHPVSQGHHRRIWAEGSPPYPTDAEVLSFYCPSCSQICLQIQTPPLVSLSLSSLHALHHPSSLHLSWNTAGGWSFVNVTNRFYSLPLHLPLLQPGFYQSLHFSTPSVAGLDEQNR